MSVHKKKIIKR